MSGYAFMTRTPGPRAVGFMRIAMSSGVRSSTRSGSFASSHQPSTPFEKICSSIWRQYIARAAGENAS